MRFMRSPFMTRTLLALLALTLAAATAFPAPPATRAEALAALENPVTERRAEAVVWVANHGRMEDTPLLLKRLQQDESPFVRGYAEQGLWQGAWRACRPGAMPRPSPPFPR
jgi:hypothetical protein